MALLDTEVWVKENQVWYEHYRKPMANPFLVMEMSAMPAKVKRTMMVHEVVRIRSSGLPWNVTDRHLNNFFQRMKASRYEQNYRFRVLKSGLEGFEKML